MSEMSVFSRLNGINVNGHTEKKNGLTYLSWAWAWAEIKKAFPDATYTIYERETEYGPVNYFTDGRTCWVKTGVTINGLEHIEDLPVMDVRNRSISYEAVNSMDVNKAIQRSLTKACARHGLGLYIYAGEDLPEDEKPEAKPEALNPEPITDAAFPVCEVCGKPIAKVITASGKVIPPEQVAQMTRDKYKACLCSECAEMVKKNLGDRTA
jgi:hypothetical protein